MVSRLLHLLIVDILTTGVALRLGSATLRPMLQAIKKNLRERRCADRQAGPGMAAAPGSGGGNDGGIDGGLDGDSDSSPSTP